MQMPARRSATAVLALSAALLVGGCTSSGGGGSAAGTPSAVASATGRSTPAASAAAGSSAAASAPAGATSSASASAPAGGGSSASPAGCQDLAATAAVKSAVTAAYEAANPQLDHIQPVPGTFFYGSCGSTRYAATRFEPTAGASQNTLVAMQDEGSVRKYFSSTGSTSWGYTGSDGFPSHGGCLALVPAGLATAWANCPAG